MAKRSDFAQKLLDDLRVRKERMAASQNSNQSNQVTIDAYSYAKQNYKGFKDTRTSEMTSPRTGNARNKYGRSNKSYIVGEASSQIVPYARGQSSEKLGNLSLALAFAVENTGKIRIDSSSRSSMLGFLQQIGTISTGFSKADRKSTIGRHMPSKSEFPILSIPHIEEISKGAQKLNQILQACSNGINFDRCSIEIGKELLKGAIDLEDSLRMLVNMQGASEHIISPQKNNRIKLLEDGEDDEDNTVEVAQQWQLDLPKFSFDKLSRQPNQELGTGHKQRLPALNEGTNYSHERQRENTLKSVSHGRSPSHGSSLNSLSTFREQNNQSRCSGSKLEKARIPNVIAKLMGLDEIPEKDNLKNTMQDSVTKQKNGRELQSSAQDRTHKAGHKTKVTENFEMPNKQKMVEINKNHVARDFAFSLQANKGVSAHVSFEEVIYDEKSPWRNLLGGKTGKIQTGPVKPTGKKEILQSATDQFKQNSENQMDNKGKERDQDAKNSREYKGTSNVILKQMLHPLEVQARKRPQSELTLQEKKSGLEENKIQIEKRHPKLPPISQLMSRNNQQNQQPFMIVKSDPQQKKHREEEKKQQRTKKNLQVKKQKGSEMMSRNLPKPIHDAINLQKKQLNTNQAKLNKKRPCKSNNSIQPDELVDGRCHDNLVGHIGSLELNINMKDSTNWNPDRNQFSTPPKKKHSELGDPVQETVLQRAKIEKEPNNESPQRINEVTHRGQKHKGHEKFCNHGPTNHLVVSQSEEAGPRISKAHRSKASRQPLLFKKENEQTSTLDTPKVDESQDAQKSQFLSLGDSIQIKKMTEKQQDQAPIFRGHELNSLIDISYKLSGTNEGSMDIYNPSELKPHKSIKPSKKELLTDGENHLKKILVKSQLFLNTADALFKLDIPISILHASSHDYEDEDGKLTLDCGYELMRRKGKRQEFAAHPCVNISLGFVKVKNFDGLIQQLHKDFEILKFYGRSGKQECDAGEYLPRMLQSDVYNNHPELSCMWDLGWNDTMFAFIEVDEIVRDIERDVLSGLVHEITRDLLPK